MGTQPAYNTAHLQTPYDAIVEALPSAVIQLDGSGQIVYANPVAQEWLSPYIVGLLWREVCAEAFSPTLDEGYLQHSSGRVLAISTSPLPVPPGQLIVLSDVSETHNLQKRVDREARLVAMGEMMARLAHQVRTPISAALLNLSHIRRKQMSHEQLGNSARRVEERLHSIEHMVRDMLMFTHGANQVDHWEDVQALSDEILTTFSPLANSRQIKLNTVVKAKGRALVSKTAFISAISNLLDNASRHCDSDDGQVRFSVIQSAEQLLLVVEDNGEGVDENVASQIFDPFFTTRSDGTGLGLPVVQSVLRNHQGLLQLGRSDLGGARFIAVLPTQRYKAGE